METFLKFKKLDFNFRNLNEFIFSVYKHNSGHLYTYLLGRECMFI